MEFAGISEEDAYASTLSEEVGVPVKWPQEWCVENLMKENERREKKRAGDREKVDFVSAKTDGPATAVSKSGVSSTNASAAGTPSSNGTGRMKTKFGKR